MAQHDYNIENQTGLGFRADLNGALQAIATQNSGTTEPADTFPGMVWLDTSTSPPTERRRNQTDDGWITTLSAAGQAVAGASDAAAQRAAMGALDADDIQRAAHTSAIAGGTADAITASFSPPITALPMAGTLALLVRANSANATTSPTFAPDGLVAKTIVKGNNLALVAGDIAGAGHWLEMNFDTTLDKWVLQNPADVATTAQAQALANNWNKVTPLRLKEAFQGSNQTFSANGYQKLPGGLIIQWGWLTNSAVANNVTAVTFPVAFTQVGVSVANGIQTTNTGAYAWVDTVTQTGFNSRASVSNAISRWLAIGY